MNTIKLKEIKSNELQNIITDGGKISNDGWTDSTINGKKCQVATIVNSSKETKSTQDDIFASFDSIDNHRYKIYKFDGKYWLEDILNDGVSL